MYCSVCWVPRGAAASVPSKGGSKNKPAVLQKKPESDKIEEDPQEASLPIDDSLKKYNLDDYDKDEDEQLEPILEEEEEEEEGDAAFSEDEHEDSEDLENVLLKETDLLVVGAKTEEQFSSCEIHLYEEEEKNLYVHHDLFLNSLPLDLEWLDYTPNFPLDSAAKGNFIAVATFNPEIEIWDLDIVDVVEPVAILGGQIETKKKQSAKWVEGSHRDSVLTLSWNKQNRSILASGSADQTVKLWDLQNLSCALTCSHHTDKVQAIEWNPGESSVILTSGFDRSACVLDVRKPTVIRTWRLPSDPESATWNPHSPNLFLVSTEHGDILCFDAFKQNQQQWELSGVSAGKKPITSLCFHPLFPGLFCCASTDRYLRFYWSTSFTEAPSCIFAVSLAEEILSISFCRDSPYLLAVASHSSIRVLELTRYEALQNRFSSFLTSHQKTKK